MWRAYRVARSFNFHDHGTIRLIWLPFLLGAKTLRLRVPYQIPPPTVPRVDYWHRFADKLEHFTASEWVVTHPPGRRWATLTLAPPLPTSVDYPTSLDHPADPWRFPIGVHRDYAGRLDQARVALDQGHLAVAGATGTGKSGLLYGLVYHAIAAGQADLWLADAKRSTFVGQLAAELREHPRVRRIVADPANLDAYLELLLAVHDDMQQRYTERDQRCEQTMAGVVARRGHAFVLLEEATELALIFKARKQLDEFLTVLGSLLRLGREAGVHIVIAGQQLNHQVVPTELRQNFVARISGWQEPTGANMLGLPEAALLPLDPEGRPLAGRVVVAGNTTRIVQAYHCPPERLLTLLGTGRAASGLLGAPAPARALSASTRAPSAPASAGSAGALPPPPPPASASQPTSAPSPAATRSPDAARRNSTRNGGRNDAQKGG